MGKMQIRSLLFFDSVNKRRQCNKGRTISRRGRASGITKEVTEQAKSIQKQRSDRESGNKSSVLIPVVR
jgi:hypothetical protein